MTILGIDTSCDETSIAVVEKQEDFKILSNVVSSQVEIHQEYGGVHPTLATRAHEKNLVPVLGEALKQADLLKSGDSFNNRVLEEKSELSQKATKFLKSYRAPQIDSIAVTTGPGLDPCLWTGINFTKILSHNWNIPVTPVNHLEAHVLNNFLNQDPELPAICLIVSGGHTQLILTQKVGQYEIVGETRDDAAGECFDKTARILGLGYPGGPAIESKAAELEKEGLNISLPRPMINSDDYDFSFSGLKTAVLYDYKERTPQQRESETYIEAMADEIQEAIVEVLVKKTLKAARDYDVNSILAGGGVAANQRLREAFKESDFNFYVPQPKFCTDNAAMIAVTAYYNRSTTPWNELKAQPNLRL